MSSIISNVLDSIWSPACLLVTLRIASLMLFCKLFGIDFQISHSTQQFSLFSVGFIIEKLTYLIQVNNASLILMFLVFSIFITIKLFQSSKFSSTRISPMTATKLVNSKFSGLIKSPFEIFWKLFIWILFVYFLLIYTAINLSLGLIYPIALGVGIIIVIFLTIFFAKVTNE